MLNELVHHHTQTSISVTTIHGLAREAGGEHGGRKDCSEEPSSKRARLDEVVEANIDSELLDNDDQGEGSEQDLDQSDIEDEPGFSYIERVVIDNFMGLNKYIVPLKKNINLISGRNGSGKSSVLCAISIGLGGDAKGTERGAKLEDLIGTFGDKAIVQVHIRLNDPESRQTWGRKVIIERTLSKGNGLTSSYKLMKVDGDRKSIISTEEQEVMNLCASLNYQVLPLNPVQFLHQNVAKTFFTQGNAKQYYEFFMRCTKLQQFLEEVQAIMEHRETFQVRVSQEQQELETFKTTEYASARRDYDQQKEIRSLAEEQKKLTSQYAWAIVEEKEAEVEACAKTEVAKAAKLLNNAKKALQEEQIKIGEADTQKQVLQAELADVRARTTESASDQSKAESEEKAARAQLREVERSIQKITDRIDELKPLRKAQAKNAQPDLLEKLEPVRTMEEEDGAAFVDTSFGEKEMIAKKEHISGLEVNLEKSIKKLIVKREHDLKAKEAKLRTLESARDVALAEARHFGPRVPVTRSDLLNVLSTNMSQIKRKEREMGKDVATVERDWKVCQLKLKKMEHHLELLRALRNECSTSVTEQVKSFKRSRHRIGMKVHLYFVKFMKKWGLTGSLDVDHKSRSLMPNVTLEHKGSGESQSVPVSQLSGEERSYTMLSFILALATESDSPILALDEFDVFMDERNRSVGLDLLIESLRDRPGRQSIIISPISMHSVKDAADITKFCMRDPDQSQPVLHG